MRKLSDWGVFGRVDIIPTKEGMGHEEVSVMNYSLVVLSLVDKWLFSHIMTGF